MSLPEHPARMLRCMISPPRTESEARAALLTTRRNALVIL